MKILYVNTVKTELNGITNAIVNLISGFRKYGSNDMIDFVSINSPSPEYIKMLKDYGVRLFVFDRNAHPIKYFFSIKRHIKKEKYDVVHIHGNSHTMAVETLAAKLGHAKLVIAHGQNSMAKHMFIHKLLTPIFNLTTDIGLACSELAGVFLFGRKKKYNVVYNGIDFDKFAFNDEKRKSQRVKLGFNEECFVLGNVARLSQEKNQIFLLDLLQELIRINDKYRLVLLGDGPDKDALVSEINKRKLNNFVHMVGFALSTDYLDSFDLLLMPSIFEGLPVSLIEAQANGLSCICSSNITRTASINNMITYISINENDSLNKWINCILEKENEVSVNNRRPDLKNSDFNIAVETRKMIDLYTSGIIDKKAYHE